MSLNGGATFVMRGGKLFTAHHNWPSSDWAGAGHWASVALVEKYSYNKNQVSTCSHSTPMEVTDITT